MLTRDDLHIFEMWMFFAAIRHLSFSSAQAWEETKFVTLNHREQPGVFILGGLEEILMVLEDNQVCLWIFIFYEHVGTFVL